MGPRLISLMVGAALLVGQIALNIALAQGSLGRTPWWAVFGPLAAWCGAAVYSFVLVAVASRDPKRDPLPAALFALISVIGAVVAGFGISGFLDVA